MPQVSSEIFIEKDPAVVYAAAKDLIGLKPYLKDVSSLTMLEDNGNITKSDWVASAMGKKIHWVEVEEWNDAELRNHFYSPEGDFDRYEGDWAFTPDANGTKVSLTLEYDLTIPIFGALLQKLVFKLMQENADGFLQGLKQRVIADQT